MPSKVCRVVNAHMLIRAGEELLLRRWTVTQRSEPPRPRLLGQTCIFSRYFWSVEFSRFKATIMPRKVCGIVSAQKSIRAGEGDGRWAIEQPNPSISLNPFAESNLRLFPWFLNRWSRLGRLDNRCHRKYRARERLVGVRSWVRIDRELSTNRRAKRIVAEIVWVRTQSDYGRE